MQKHLVLVLGLVVLLSDAALAQTSAVKIPVAGMKAEVVVHRDARGIPYIEAKSDADAYFAQGYMIASDRLWQMDLLRRVARGETAELFGNASLEEDKRYRRFHFAKIADETLKHLPPDLVAALESYSAGVNAYITGLTDATMPAEFKILQTRPREWRPADCIVIGKILSDALSNTWRNDIMRASIQGLAKEKLAELTDPVTPFDVVLFGSDVKANSAAATGVSNSVIDGGVAAASENDDALRRRSLERVGLFAEDLAASNNWVISGRLTADGKPILANDPHLAPTTPGIWWLVHISAPGMRVAGVTIPGAPGVILGHNENIAWGATNVGPDVQDLYIETFQSDGKYKTPEGWASPVVRKESINVRGNLLRPETNAASFDVVETRNGPVIFEESGKKYSLKWTAFDPKNNEFEAFWLLNRAKDWEDFKAALRRFGGAAQNFIYADLKGNIGWYAASRIPIRRTGDGALPYDGSTTDGDWVGTIPFEELPNLYNPKSGMIVTANQRIVGTRYRYPQMSRDAAAPWRARRIVDELSARKKITFDDVRDVQHDAYSIPLAELAKQIVSMKAASQATLDALSGWDGRMLEDSKAALLVNEMRLCLGSKIADANKPAPAGLMRERILYRAIAERSARWLPAEFTSYDEMIRSCDMSVRSQLADPKRFGPDESAWRWGKAWQSRFPHPLAAAPLIGAQFAAPNVPIAGSGQSPNVGSAVSMRLIASPGNWDATRHVIPMGESGDPRSPHFRDQFDLWKNGTAAVFPFSKAAVFAAAKTTVVLTPR